MSITEPRLGTGATIIQDNRLLLIRRRRAPEAGAWGLPGGKVDLYETAAAAAEREIREETGLIVKARDLLCTVDQIDRSAGEHWFAPVYLIHVEDADPRIMEPNKHDGLEWFALDDLPSPLTTPTRTALPALRARFNLRSAGGAS